MARDVIHDAVKNALKNDGWTITHDPYPIRYQTIKVAADLGAERTLAAERSGQKIAVEIKSFLSPSPVQDFKLALGQYVLYLGLLEIAEPDRKLYLAVDQLVFTEFLEQEAIQMIRRRYQVAVVVVNVANEEVVQWID